MTMSSRNRVFVIAAALVLLVGLATGFVAYYLGFPGASAGPEELRFVSRDAAVLASVNLRELMASEARRKLWGAVPTQNIQEFRDQTGIDLERDIDRIVASVEPHAGDESTALMLARGRFEESRIETLVRQNGGEVESYKGKRLLIA